MKNTEKNNSGFAILGDDPANIETDCLDFCAFVKPLSDRMIKSVGNTPFTIGIFADWGQGKTTIMHILQKHLSEAGCPTIWFDPWKYNSREDVWKGLSYTLVTQIKKNDSLWKEIHRKRERLANWLGGFLFSKILGNTWGGNLVKAVANEPWSPGMLHEFEGTIDKLLKLIDGKNASQSKVPLVLFVDDLDRCLPDAALAVMEAMKLVLNRQGLIIVMGIAESELSRAVYAAYAKEFKESMETEKIDIEWGRKYIRKIIQVPFPVPVISDVSLDKYVANCLEKSRVFDCLDSRPEWNGIIREACKGNLRQVKRFINSFISEMDKAAANTDALGAAVEVTLDAPRVIFILLLAWRFRKFIDHIRERAHIRDLLYRYQLYFITKPEKENARVMLQDGDELFYQDIELETLFIRCFSSEKEGTFPLVRPFSGWQDLFPFLQFGVLPLEDTETIHTKDQTEQETHVEQDEMKHEISKEISDSIAEAQSLISSSRFDAARKNIEQALSKAEKLQDKRGKAALLNLLGSLHQLQGNYSDAVTELGKSLDISRDFGDLHSMSTVLREMATNFRQIGNLEEALASAKESYDLAQQSEDTLTKIDALGEIASVFEIEKRSDEELTSLNEMLSLAKSQGINQATAMAYLRIGDNLARKGDKEDAFNNLNNALSLAQSSGDAQIQSKAHEKIADYYQNFGDIEKAIEHQKTALQLFEKLPDKEERAKATWRMAQLFRAKGDEKQSNELINKAIGEAGELTKPVLAGDIHADFGQWNLENKKIENAISAFNDAARSYKKAGFIDKSNTFKEKARNLSKDLSR